ncbi:MAG: sulfurtransferase complex subunit TusB [Halomonas sp.]|nr:sulfurtransferase complex subunit TusB [Halomonas sp.]TVP51265.1 MAG: sulfurtransferase complex subunit TusB [Halomonas sp.]
MILHILTKAPYSSVAQQMQQAIGEADAVLLVEEGVTAALSPSWTAWKAYHSRIYILAEDLLARGLNGIAEANELPVIGMDEFVTLTEKYAQTVTWY